MWDLTKQSHIGKLIHRRFNAKVVRGKVLAYLAPAKKDSALWRVVYDDGDEEDLFEAELLSALQLHSSLTGQGQKRHRRLDKGDRGEDPKRSRRGEGQADKGCGLLVEGVQKGDTCAICQENMGKERKRPHALIQLGTCKHVFHSECIQSASQQWRNHCPLCKAYYSVRRTGIL